MTVARARVLLVEDNALVALDLATFLEELGLDVLGPYALVADALAALAEMAAPPDLALLDVQLVDRTSEPVAERLLALGVPFLVLSAYARDFVPKALQAATAYMTKPVDLKQLRTVMLATLDAALP